jgi:AcrR family transcriptional regulator
MYVYTREAILSNRGAMTTRQRSARGSGDQLRDQLVAAASELLLVPQSIALPSLRAVARACSVSPAAVYLHFDSQQALIAAVIEAQVKALEQALDAGVASSTTATERIQAFGIAYATWGIEHPGAYQLLFESADRLGDAVHEADWSLLDNATVLIAAATRTDLSLARVTTFRIWTALHGIVSLRLHKVDTPWPTTLDVEVRTIMDLLTR